MSDPDAGVTTDMMEAVNMSLTEQQGVLASFGAFLQYCVRSELCRALSESKRVREKCGEPCMYDELIHTESMSTEWASLLKRYPGLPQVELPRARSL